MEELIPITEVSKKFEVSTRTLRYYEQIGLIQSEAKKDYAYRVYSLQQLERLRQILVLRKLRVSLKQIMKIFENAEIADTLVILTKNMQETQDEINYLSTVKGALNLLIEKLRGSGINFLDNSGLTNILSTLPASKKLNERKKVNVNEINNIEFHSFRKLKDSEVRIITLPPATVASCRFDGDTAEERASAAIDDFVRKNDLVKIKPDLRRYGFTAFHTDLNAENRHSYEMRVTIPDDLRVSAPLKKKKFEGGLYASYMIPMDTFDGWDLLYDWVINSDRYEIDNKGGHDAMQGCLDELLNYVHYVTSPSADADMQLDLLIPVRVIENSDNKNIKNETFLQLEARAHQGSPDAQWNFAYRYFKGYKGAGADYPKAAEWFQKSANQGYAKAQCSLGYCYINGFGLPKNEQKAAELYEKAATQNYAAAMINLAWCYMAGTGVPQDYEKGKYWLKKAAAQNQNPKAKRHAGSTLNDLSQLLDRDDIKLIFQRRGESKIIDKDKELRGKNNTLIKIIITDLSY